MKADTGVIVQHNQRTKKFNLTAMRPDGSRVKLKYKIIDSNRIEILTRDTMRVKVTVNPRRKASDTKLYKTAQYMARFLMMVRSVSINYSNKFNLSVPGFLPNVGDIFGQRGGGTLAPGLGFAFGTVGENYVARAADRGWLLMSDSIITPATSSATEDLQIRATLEPFRDFKIDLSATRSTNKAKSIQYMYEGMPTTQTGSFTQTTLSISTAFEKMGSADRGYPSKAFSRFVRSLDRYQQRVESRYNGAQYPASSALAGKTFDPANGTVSKYSADVMIPAFLDAYTVNGGGLNIFPTLAKLLPNWTLSYAGLAKLTAMKRIFKSFNLTHGYKSIYSVGSYSTYTSWLELMGQNYGWVTDVSTGMPTPSSMFDISTVSINESFSPLLGVDMTFLNNISAKVEFRKTRVLTLSMTNQQISETRSNDFVIGMGYKIADFKIGSPKKTVRAKKAKGRKNKGDADSNKAKETTQSKKGDIQHTLNLRFDFSLRNQSAINRNILTETSEATSGNKAVQISFSADYQLSKALTLTAYYDRQMNKPLLTSSSYPTTTQDFGISFKFSLNH